jgi:5-oxoprolinase (ATP-hydrolysing)
LTVGPDSAGATPGPLCYGDPAARDIALTDANLLLGRVVPERFPIPLDVARVRAAFAALAAAVSRDGATRRPEELAAGFVEIADQAMAEAIRQVTVAHGRDVREYVLVVFGAAGGQHACSLARRLGIRRILFHRFAGVLSAWGMGLADVTWSGSADAGRLAIAPDLAARLGPAFGRLEAEGRGELAGEGFAAERIGVTRRVDLRYRGSDTAITLALRGDGEVLRADFEREHLARFGFTRPDHEVEVLTVRVEVVGRAAALASDRAPLEPPATLRPASARRTGALWVEGALRAAPVHLREELAPGSSVIGPALVLEETGTIVVDPGFALEVVDADRAIVRALAPDRGPGTATSAGGVADARPDPVLLEVFNHLFMSVATQMGAALERTAVSTNIRERRDFSCAVFDARGGLVANAPHIPVHLGAMGESVRAVIAAHPEMAPGDVFATNDPAGGGSHLPDVTVVTPVHDERGQLLFFAASRGHHADVGGIAPGSMPSFSSSLAEEGVVLSNLAIVRAGRFDEKAVRGALGASLHPARAPDDNVADLQAQIAANRLGAALLGEIAARHGTATVLAYMQHVQDNAAAQVAAEIARLPDGEHAFADALDDGTPIRVAIRVRGDRMAIDFSGTGAQVAGNLNAPRAVTLAAVIYVLRALVDAPIPLNSGCLRPVAVHIPPGSVLDPSPGAAVCGGNVETSQRVVDVLLGALGLAAASQGTMNNLTFGDAGLGYYETIAGGAGAGPGFAGAAGVHTHMTNTRITDPEVLETRYPVRLIEFSLRPGSGGAGRWPGGDGVVREIELLRPLSVSILSERRAIAPFGLDGGGPGRPGRNLWNGRDVGGKATFDARAGDRIRIETPGGGGFGRALPRPG